MDSTSLVIPAFLGACVMEQDHVAREGAVLTCGTQGWLLAKRARIFIRLPCFELSDASVKSLSTVDALFVATRAN